MKLFLIATKDKYECKQIYVSNKSWEDLCCSLLPWTSRHYGFLINGSQFSLKALRNDMRNTFRISNILSVTLSKHALRQTATTNHASSESVLNGPQIWTFWNLLTTSCLYNRSIYFNFITELDYPIAAAISWRSTFPWTSRCWLVDKKTLALHTLKYDFCCWYTDVATIFLYLDSRI